MNDFKTLLGPVFIALLALLCVGLAFTLDSYSLLVFTLCALAAVVGVGLNILIGLSGQISFGHIAFYAIGAYVSALLTIAGWPLWLAMPVTAVVTGLIGALLAIPALRVSGPYLAMITIAFAFIVHHGLIEWRDVTGGSNGLMGIPLPEFAGLDPAILLALIAAALMIGALAFYQRLRHSGFGKAMRAVKAAEIAARSLGFNPVLSKTLAFALSAALTGLAGAVLAPLLMFINPESFPFSQSILFVLAVIVGGSGTLFGPLLGALLIVLVPELLSDFAEYRLLIFSALLLIVLWIAPNGLLGALARRWIKPTHLVPPNTINQARLAAHLQSRGRSSGLRVTDIGIRFGGVQAAQHVSLHAPAASITSIIGPNGAGKTTVLNMISGFYAPDSGQIELQAALAGLPAWKTARAGIARTYQTTQLFGDMSVLDNLLVAMQKGRLGSPFRLCSAEQRDLALDLLALVGYRGAVNIAAEDLPHVDRRLVEIARALATAPAVLLLDEPAAGLSRRDTDELAVLLRKLADFGLTIILVEHDMALVMSVSERLLVLDAGKPIAFGTPAEIRQNKQVIAAYLGGTDYQATPREQTWNGSRDARLYVKDLVIDYGAAPVVNKVNLVVNPGEMVAILGANGAGKSSILQCLAGLHRAASGSILLDDENIEMASASGIAGKGLALVPEGRQVFPYLTVRDNLLLGGYSRREAFDAGAEIEAILRRFPRLRDRIDSPAGLLSGGEQQMVAVGRGLMAKPKILLLDEPSLGLSPAMIGELYDALAALRDDGVTLLLVDQMANLALQVADRAYVLETGCIVKSGSAAQLRGDNELAAAYLGEGVSA
ncbi:MULTISPECIES: branched-chain amino acid ABC transporter ATP-binding protein/permease [unclassified Pseudomonas]|uniref:branched-chain amino acid ABC transporter ATP-binding protein/permease n=1 Tax=unclassified Pseudomonas TaxID=196821 RepID=UPI001B32B5A5|nr:MULTISPECIES: branched-chain amino acid ABC transporter ATP-binding protein/permease [unclassified Pseudomonas]MBP5946966.1 ATP-binding cassette domain-containing protein [Pseudomonas sp. P9(2020)]MBZ9565104.1 ATP-binding cassette domain-containing protein [Pseudomonas sp. P116]